jgi:formylglycine-generating enzyme required for sulfatase activity
VKTVYRICPLALVCTLFVISPVSAQGQTKKIPVPSAAAQGEAAKLIKEVYGDEYAKATTATQKQALAKKLLEKATETKDDPAGQFVLLRLAKDIATQASDSQTAFDAIDRTAGAFQVDGNEMKTAVLTKMASAAKNPDQHKTIAEQALELIENAIACDNYEVANQLARLALDESRKGDDASLVSKTAAKQNDLSELVKAYERAKAARVILEKTPDDPEANSAVGGYLCFAKGDWEKGLPMLALGRDEALRSIAQRELGNPTSSAEQAKLGDLWWNFAENQEGISKKRMQWRAGYWYEKALPGLSGLTKDKVEKRVTKMADVVPREADGGSASTRPPVAVAPFNEKAAKMHQARWAKYLGVPVVQTNSIGMKVVLIPPGEFQMGSSKELIAEELRRPGLEGWYRENLPGEAPQHHVRITKPFLLGAMDVTQGQYQRVMGNNPSKFQGDSKRPVEQVSWDDATEFCRRLSELHGEKAAKRQYVLPTEAQWEYACRAGSTGRWCFSAQRNPLPAASEEKLLGEYAWFKANASSQTHPVGQKRANAWGLYDMHGNVWNWCQDWYDKDYYSKSTIDDPAGPPEGSRRVIRGSNCWVGAGSCGCGSAYRDGHRPGDHENLEGIRVSVVPAEK